MFNSMLDSWNTEGLAVYGINRKTFNLVGSQQSYTIGNSQESGTPPNWDTSPDDRPQMAPMASSLINISGQPTEIPMEGLTTQQWQLVPVKYIQADYPIKYWYDYQFPYANFWVWPVPTQVNQIVLYIPTLLVANAASGSTVVVVPQGYIRAIEYNLALELAPRFSWAVVNPVVLATAVESKANIKRANTRIVDASVDDRVVLSRVFNLWSGSYVP